MFLPSIFGIVSDRVGILDHQRLADGAADDVRDEMAILVVERHLVGGRFFKRSDSTSTFLRSQTIDIRQAAARPDFERLIDQIVTAAGGLVLVDLQFREPSARRRRK